MSPTSTLSHGPTPRKRRNKNDWKSPPNKTKQNKTKQKNNKAKKEEGRGVDGGELRVVFFEPFE